MKRPFGNASFGGSGGSNGSNGFDTNNVASNDPTLVGIGQGASFAACLATIKWHVATLGAGGAGGLYVLSFQYHSTHLCYRNVYKRITAEIVYKNFK